MTILMMGKLLFLSGSQFLHLKSGGGVGSVNQMNVRVKFKAQKEALTKLLVFCLNFLICNIGIQWDQPHRIVRIK